MSKPLRGKSFLSVIMDEMVDDAKNMIPIPTYNIHHLCNGKGSNLVICSTRGAGKTSMMLSLNTLLKIWKWEVRVKHHNAPVKVQFT